MRALSFLSATSDRLRRFLESSGLTPETFRAAAESPDFFAGLLDYIVSDDEVLITFAAEVGLKPEMVMQARRTLSSTEFLE